MRQAEKQRKLFGFIILFFLFFYILSSIVNMSLFFSEACSAGTHTNKQKTPDVYQLAVLGEGEKVFCGRSTWGHFLCPCSCCIPTTHMPPEFLLPISVVCCCYIQSFFFFFFKSLTKQNPNSKRARTALGVMTWFIAYTIQSLSLIVPTCWAIATGCFQR